MKVNGFNVEHDLQAAITVYDRMFLKERKVQFAMAAALTKTGQDVKARLEVEIKNVFDRPKPVTQNSLFLQPATKSRLAAEVKIKDKFISGFTLAKTLEPQVSGGRRGMGGFEKALRQYGILPPGLYAVPGEAVRLDAYGNMPKGQIVQIMSQLRIQNKAGYASALSSDKKKAAQAIKRAGGLYFYADIGGTKGIWQREPGRPAPKPILIFVRAPNYKPRLAFRRIAEEVARQKIYGNMRTAIIKEHEDAARYAARTKRF